MEAPDDIALLRRWAEDRSEAAFRLLVERHAALVWGVALRKTADRGLAEEAMQQVFIDLAKKAPVLVAWRRPLGPWLHRSALYEAVEIVRRETRHANRLKQYAQDIAEGAGDDPWAAIAPHLDEAIQSLGAADRRVLLLHWFERLTFAEVAERTASTPGAAQRRGARALEKLAALLHRRGVAVPVTVLGAGLSLVLSPSVPAAVLDGLAPTAAGATASAFSLPNFASAMATAKISTAAAFVIAAAIPVGVRWTAAAFSSPPAPPQTLSAAPEPAVTRPPSTKKAPLDLSLVRSALDRLLSQPDDYETQLQLRRLMLSLSADEIPPVRDLLLAIGGEKKEAVYDVVHAFFARWAELDGPAATEAARATGKQFGFYAIRGAFITWSAADIDGAWTWLEKNVSSSLDRQFLGGEALATQVEMARDGATVMARADAVQDADWRKNLRYWAMRAWTRHGSPDSILKWALALPESPEREERIAETIEQIGEERPDALPYVQHIENPARRDEVAHNILWPYLLARNPSYRVSPPDFVDDMANLTTRYSPDLFRDAGDAIARHGAHHAVAKLAQLPAGEARDEFIKGMLRSVDYGEAKLMLPAVAMLGDDALLHSGMLSHFTDALTKQDPRAAAEWIASLPEKSVIHKWAGSHFQAIAGKSAAAFLKSSPQ